jgi:hypothetical protein
MKYLIVLFSLLFYTSIQAQGVMLLVGSDGTVSRDSIPAQYAFTDSVDAAVSTEILSAGVVLAGFDSAYVNVTGGDYRINFDGDTTRVASIIALGDTLFAIDTSSASNSTATNVAFTIGGVVDTFSVTTVAASNEYATDSLKYYWDDDDLAEDSSLVQNWVTNTSSPISLTLTQGTESERPAATATGLTFDGGDNLAVSTPAALVIDSAMSVELVLYVADTTGADHQTVFSVKDGSDEIQIVLDATTGKLNGYARGQYSLADSSWYSTPLYQAMKHVILTYDGYNLTEMYIDGVKQTKINRSSLGRADADAIQLGSYNTGEAQSVASGTKIRLIRFYAKALTQEEVTGNYNSTSVQGKLP